MRGRHKDAVPRERKDLRIRADIMAQVDLLLLDPARQKVDYGKWSELVEELLQEWLARRTSGITTVNRTKVAIALKQLQTPGPDLQAVTQLLQEALGQQIVVLTTPPDGRIISTPSRELLS